MKTYEAYKESGVNWIGEIPEDWQIKKMKWITSIKRGASPRPIADTKYFDEDGEYSWVRIADVSASERYLLETKEKLSELGSSLSVKRYPGDFFLSIAGSVGKPIVTKIKCCIHDGFVWFPELTINPEFLYYIFQSDLPFGGLGKVGTQLNLNTETIGNIEIPFICENDINSIVAYLDHKTTIIDALIDKKEQLIKKLQAQRKAIINEAVTKGLNSNVKMKDSGVEWLGKIPEHWGVCKIKHLAELKSGNFISANNIESEGQYPVYGGNGLRGYSVDFTHEGSHVLIGRQGAHCGNIKYAHDKFWATEHAVVITFKSSINIDCFGELLRAMNLNQYNESAAQPGLAVNKIDNLNIPKIPIGEQNEIAHFIKNKISITHSLVNIITKQLIKLKSYRQSIISEAVTGKVDVRNWKAPSKN
jgi:type I restriction enzyme S subunit